ncbi:uncharacterized protein FFB20_15917 [Fusarium fujikuroi]|nr:uncharacterized protein FFB20_15917 [Fusarium fujikuroi]
MGRWEITLTLTDCWGQTRKTTRSLIGIDKRDQDEPILLSIATLKDLRIVADFETRKWWFKGHHGGLELLKPRQFLKKTRNGAKIFAITIIEEPYLLPGEEPQKPDRLEGIPHELKAHIEVFSYDKAVGIPDFKKTDHVIDLVEGKEPPYGPIYPLSQAELKELREYIQENLKTGRIRPFKSPAGSPILFVPKKDGGLRLCVDYRGLNAITIKNRYPLPLISEIMDRIQGAKYFSKIDVKDAYHRIRIRKGDEWKTAFRTRYGHFEYVVMPFGLANAPATFQHYIHQALQGLVDTICIVYLDDILIFSKTREEHTKHLKQILERMKDAELYAKPSKCSFYQDRVEFLGFILTTEGIEMDLARIRTILEWPEPTTYREIQVFLGFCNFYRRFIYGYSKVTAPLTALMKGSQNGKKPGSVRLNDQERQSFRALIAEFGKAPVLRHFDPERHIRVETDASDYAMAGILSQPDDEGRYHPIAFWSRKFNDPERRYGTPDQEMMAIVESFKHWRHYLEGSLKQVEVLSDHQNLQSFMKNTKLNGRQARWCLYLMTYDFVIKHRKGSTNPADAPSRPPGVKGEKYQEPDLIESLRDKMAKVQVMTRGQKLKKRSSERLTEGASPPRTSGESEADEMSLGVKDDPALLPSDADVTGQKPSLNAWSREILGLSAAIPNETVNRSLHWEKPLEDNVSKPLIEIIRLAQSRDKTIPSRKDKISKANRGEGSREWKVKDNLLYFKDRLYVLLEPNLRKEILGLYHDDPLAGHFGIKRTQELIQRKLHWEGLETDVKQYVSTCRICQGTVSKRHRPYGKLESLPIPSRPFEEVSMDFVTGLPPVLFEGQQVDAILVIVDRLTKFVRFLPVSTKITASELAELFHKEIELWFGAPKGIVSDRGSVFTSAFWSELCYHLRIKQRLSTAFHPQTDGQMERMNQVLGHYLRCFIGDNQNTWPKLLRTAQFACNSGVSATTNVTPNRALMGFDPEFHIAAEDISSEGGVPEVRRRIQKLQELRDKLATHWRNATERQAKYFNSKH